MSVLPTSVVTPEGAMIEIRIAEAHDIDAVSAILVEAAEWLESRGMASWKVEDLGREKIEDAVLDRRFALCLVDGQPAGTLRFQLSDPEFWPELDDDDSAFIHKLAVRRQYAGGGISGALIKWAIDATRSLDRRFLRLDCNASRERLRAFYEALGFTFHSEIQRSTHRAARYEMRLDRSRP